MRIPFSDAFDLADDIALARRVERRLAPGEQRTADRVERGDDAMNAAADLAAQEG
ncbi:MAG: hypothetical protein L6R48_15295 [Planctomycetes bacterium]|nr:hypothetical protein [Planctomycetota bacterium]